jgi:hypothetical protein
LRERRCLLVLDNSETLFEPGQREGRYRTGMAGYGRLFRAVGDASHQSCLVVTSRETPPELVALGGAVRTLELSGLGVDEAQVLLAAKPHWRGLERCAVLRRPTLRKLRGMGQSARGQWWL